MAVQFPAEMQSVRFRQSLPPVGEVARRKP